MMTAYRINNLFGLPTSIPCGLAVFGLAVCGLTGCQTPLDLSNLTRNDDVQRLALDEESSRPWYRWGSRKSGGKESNSLAPAAGLQAYRKAEKLYDDKQYKDAEKAFKKIAKQYKDSPVAEDALFMKAESQFAQNRFSWAQDSYDELIKQFETTRHMDRVTFRLYTIGRTWLEFPEIATSEEIQQVDFENLGSSRPQLPEKEKSFDPTRSIPILPNFHDQSRPVFDTNGRALQALKSIWLNDPTGSLADDALMLTASHYLRSGNNVEADRYFTMVREEYPKSPHFQNAFLLGSHVKLMSYQGASYDGKSLEDAKSLKATSLRMFANTADRERLETEIAKIGVAEADRDWEMVKYWQGKNELEGAAVYCREIIRRFPRTQHATRARKLLAEIEPGSVAASAPRDLPARSAERQRIPRELFDEPAKPSSRSPLRRLKDWMPDLRPVPKREDEPSTLDPTPSPNGLQQASTPRSSRPSRFSVGSPLKNIKDWWSRPKPVPSDDADDAPKKPTTTLDVTGRVKL